MIVKNEEEVLGKCLNSIKPIADELVICDTGSEDSTVDLIKDFAKDCEFPVILKHTDWEKQGFFSGNRNYGLKFCTKRWIFWIDADEWLYPESYHEVKQISERGDIYAAFCSLLSDLPDGRLSQHFLPKFFRRGTAHFEGIVHNQLVHASPAAPTGVKIHHTGYALSVEKMASKRKRSAKLLYKQIEEESTNSFAYMNLSRIKMNDNEHQKAMGIAEEGLKHGGSSTCRQMLYYSVAVCATHLGDYEKAANACWAGLRLNPNNLDMTFTLANIAMVQKQHERVITYLNRYLQLKEQESDKPQLHFLILDFYEARDKAYTMLGIAYDALGMQNEALNAHRQAVKINPHPNLLKNLAAYYEKVGNILQAREIWSQLIERGYVDDLVLTKVRG